jgi:hypothetical protein
LVFLNLKEYISNHFLLISSYIEEEDFINLQKFVSYTRWRTFLMPSIFLSYLWKYELTSKEIKTYLFKINIPPLDRHNPTNSIADNFIYYSSGQYIFNYFQKDEHNNYYQLNISSLKSTSQEMIFDWFWTAILLLIYALIIIGSITLSWYLHKREEYTT